ncbi:hypothetical protein WH240_10280 [Gluconobacter wancherniae]|uniref:hypothetical protein n=1 Tax=Gluconobacter wancherniae TaxID=1307955 RepID=UPI0030AD365B
MNLTSPSTRLWIMDWHGWMLDHDPVSDSYARSPFRPGYYPGLSFIAPADFSLPCPLVAEKSISMPRALPQLTMIETPRSPLVALSRQKPESLVTCAPVPGARGEVHFNATVLNDWEMFLPMTGNMVRGLGILMEASASTMSYADGTPCDQLVVRSGMTAQTGTFRFSLAAHHDQIEGVSLLGNGETLTLHLTSVDGETSHNLTVKRAA